MPRRLIGSCIALALLGIGRTALASDCDAPDPTWLLCEDFEDGGVGWAQWYAQSSWAECDGCPDGTNDADRIRLEQDAALAHDGEISLHMPGTSDAFLGGTLRFATCEGEPQGGCTLEGHDRLYFRTWVRLAADHDYVHHFLGIGGSRPDAYWEANGNAGCRPNGERWAGTRVDLNPEHVFFFYTYFPGMSCDAGGYCSGSYAEDICAGCADIDMPCENGLECCWGNHFEPEQPVVVPTEEWTCIEMMMELNTPGMADGTMAFWVNDALAHEVTGMAWRDVPELQLNRAMLEHYIDVGDTDHPNAVWFDDVVVGTQPIGCSGRGGGGSEGGGDDTGVPADGGASGPTPGDDGTATSDGSATDDGEGTRGEDGGATAAGSIGSGGTGDGAQTGESDASGCACRTSDRPREGAWLAIALGLFLVGARRRRAAALIVAASGLGCESGGDGADATSPVAETGLASTGEPSEGTDDDASPTSVGDGLTSTIGSDGTGEDGDASSSDGGDTGEETGEPGCVPWTPWFHDGFDTYAAGQSLSGNDPFDAAGRTTATDEAALAGTQSARMEIRPEDGGGFGQWGAVLPLPDLDAGRSVWVRLWVRWPAAFEFSAEPWMKFLRLHNRAADGGNAGYNDLYVDNADGDTSVLRVIKEVHDVWEVYDGPPLPRDTWERYEIQLVIDHVPVDDGGQARFRVWRDDALIFDRTDVPTITAAGGVIDALYVFTYWNNEMPPNNVAYVDELTVAFDDTPPPETDASGNPRIGGWLPCTPRSP
jgi:MYXO-CTERM domain-containing protein